MIGAILKCLRRNQQLHKKKNELLDLIKQSDIDFNNNSDLKTKIIQVTELAYGSYPIQLKMKLDSQQDKESLIK